MTFSHDEVLDYLSQRQLTTGGLALLSFAPGEISTQYRGPFANPMCRRPLLVAGDRVIVISPSTVLIAIRDAVLERAYKHGVGAEVADTFRATVQSRIEEFADLQRWRKLGSRQVKCGGTTVDEAYFQFDGDKVAVTYAVCDDLRTGSTEPDKRHWDLKGITRGLQRRILAAEKTVFASPNAPREILHVILFQGIGRPSQHAIKESGDSRAIRVALTVDEFRVFALLNLNDELALWQVAQALHRLPKRTSLVFGGFLDHYAIYRNRGESYYFGDEGVMDGVMLVATGIHVRLEIQRRLDPHVVRRPQSQSYGPVMRLQCRPGVPIYAVPPSRSRDIQFLVEGLSVPVWVLAEETLTSPRADHRDLYFHLTDALAFWLWQITPSLATATDGSSLRIRELVVRVVVSAPEKWTTIAPTDGKPSINMTVAGPAELTVDFAPAFAAESARPENSAERELVRLLVRHIWSILALPLTPDEERAILDRHAPVGEKRRFLIIRGALLEMLSTDGLPHARKVQQFDESAIADLLGAHLQWSQRHGSGDVSDEKRHLVCNQAVAYCYEELRAGASELSPDLLLEGLIGWHESLIADRRQLEVTTATHLSCFGHSEENIRELQREAVELDKASIASRFLVEYLTAQPPEGVNRLSASAYDRLLALASEIAYYGRFSDSLRYGVSSPSLELLRSGRLALSDPQFERATGEFLDAFYQRVAERSENAYREAIMHSQITSQAPMPKEAADLEEATIAEFGLPLSQLCGTLGTIYVSPYNSPSGVGRCRQDELLSYLSVKMGLDKDALTSAVGLFTLSKRADFLKPSPPYLPADVYPWRFNRGLSYLRKPLLARTTGDSVQLLWGCRAIRQALDYFVNLCTNGRLKGARSARMREYQGTISNRLGRAFNDRVGAIVQDTGRFVVKLNLKKFNGKRLRSSSGNDLGDIDVLAARQESRSIFAVEVKCFSLAKTPAELANERDELFGDLANRTGAVRRHLERTEWLRNNLGDVLRELRLETQDCAAWRVEPLLVIESDLITPKLVVLPFPIVTLDNLLSQLMN